MAMSTLKVTPLAMPVTAMKPMPTPTSMSSARILSGNVGPLTTRRTVSRKDRQSRTNAIRTANVEKALSGSSAESLFYLALEAVA